MDVQVRGEDQNKRINLPVHNVNASAGGGAHQPETGGDAPKTSDQLYLDKLKFNPALRKSWLNFFIVNFRVVILLIVLLTALGLYSFTSLPRESSPEVKIPIAVVMTAYPGASPSDVEELVTKKIETGIAGVKDVSKITSQSSNSISAVTVEFDAKANLDDSLRKLRDAVTNVKPDLPTDANDPQVLEISLDDTPIWTIALSGPYDGFTLRSAADDLKDELEKIPGVREVRVSGGDEKEWEVAYDPQKLTFYNLSPDQVNQMIRSANLAIPAGNFSGEKYTYPIRTDSRFKTVADLASLAIFHTDGGALITLQDVATVRETAVNKTVYSRQSTLGAAPLNDVTLQLVKKTGGNIINTVAAARAKTTEQLKKMPPGMTYAATIDMAEQIDHDFTQLGHDFIITLVLVFVILFLIVGFKEALVAGLAIPLVFFATFGAMLATGISLNFLSLFSLILALGLLVDDAIVVVSATKQYLRTGKFTPEEAVLLVLNDFKVVLTTTTLTTVWAFLPLLLSTGIMGEYIKSIPITVSVTLIASLIIALVINHPLAAVLERVRLTRKLYSFFLILLGVLFFASLTLSNKIIGVIFALVLLGVILALVRWYYKRGREYLKNNSRLVAREWADDEMIKKKLREQGARDSQSETGHGSPNLLDRFLHGIINFHAVLPVYEKYLRKIIATRASRLKTIGVILALFIAAVALPATGVLKSEFFPVSDYELVFLNIQGPAGLKLEETDKIAARVEAQLLKYKEIASFSTIVGQPSSLDSFVAGSNSSNLASITLRLVNAKQRRLKSYELADLIRKDLSSIKEATITVESPTGGPPAGAAFEAHIAGDNLETLDKIAGDLKPYLTKIPGVVNADISLKESPADYTFRLDYNRLQFYNLNAAYVGSALRLAIAGTEVTTVLENGKEIKVIARFARDRIPDLAAIQNLQILNLRQEPVFLKDVAKIELTPSVDTITRIDQKRVVLLTAGVSGQTNATQVVKEFQTNIKNYSWPEGYGITYGGANEQDAESVLSILRAMIVAGILIISTLIVQFNSVKKALIVLITIPLALIGVFFGMAIAGINLSFPGLIGILALFGIVVKNAIILMDKINLNLKSGIGYEDAVVDAGKARLEAIFITSICTIFGIIPITFSSELWRALGGAIIFGLLLSSFLTLFAVPTLFVSFIKDKKIIN